jgi:hypothetical protein
VQAVSRRGARASRALAGAALAGAALAGPLAPLAPAGAVPSGAGVGCTGSTCSVQLSGVIRLKGDFGAVGSASAPLNVPPPPCVWQPLGDAVTGSRTILKQFGTAAASVPFGVHATVQQARRLLAARPVPRGTWFQLPVNPAASPAAQSACLTLPLFFFARPGQAPPAPPVPLTTLAAFAYDHMTIPVPRVTVNPAGHGYVNLATYVWARTRPVSATTGRPGAYEVIATLGAQTVSVWAQPATPGALRVGVGSGHGAAYSGCGPGGSRFPVGRVPASAGAAGTAPDCGVLWQAPDAAATVSVTARWMVTWAAGVLHGPGNRRLPVIALTGRTAPLRVAEIQSINGG